MRTTLAALLLLALVQLAAAAPAPLARRTNEAAAELAGVQSELARQHEQYAARGYHLLGVRRGSAPHQWVVSYTYAPTDLRIESLSLASGTHEMTVVASPSGFASALSNNFHDRRVRIFKCKGG